MHGHHRLCAQLHECVQRLLGIHVHPATAHRTISANGNQVEVGLDAKAIGQLHVIAEVKDNGVHPMTRYVRFVIEVEF